MIAQRSVSVSQIQVLSRDVANLAALLAAKSLALSVPPTPTNNNLATATSGSAGTGECAGRFSRAAIYLC
jgi:hypothetical protein